MCEHSRKLVAWMDGELGERDAAMMETHVRECAECLECLAAYQQASAGFEAYCEAVVDVADTRAAEKRREIPPLLRTDRVRDDNVKRNHGGLKPAATRATRMRVAIGAGGIAAAAAIAMLLTIPRHRVEHAPAPPSTASSRPGGAAAVPDAAPERGGAMHAVQRPAQQPESAGTVEPARKDSAMQTETLPGAHIAKRPAPLAIATGAVQRRTAERPTRLEEARRVGRQAKNQASSTLQMGDTNGVAAEAPIEIAVPTENMFPPGAVPAGIGFTAVVTISADDGAQSAGAGSRFAKVSNGGNR